MMTLQIVPSLSSLTHQLVVSLTIESVALPIEVTVGPSFLEVYACVPSNTQSTARGIAKKYRETVCPIDEEYKVSGFYGCLEATDGKEDVIDF